MLNREQTESSYTPEADYEFLEGKCAETNCWHYSARGYIYCICCLYGECESIPKGEHVLYEHARRRLKGLDKND